MKLTGIFLYLFIYTYLIKANLRGTHVIQTNVKKTGRATLYHGINNVYMRNQKRKLLFINNNNNKKDYIIIRFKVYHYLYRF